MNTIFIKKLGKNLTGLSKLHKNKESLPAAGGKHENQNESVWERDVPLAQKTSKSGEYQPKRRDIQNI